MEVIPAIDLRGGRCVRLLQGDYARETVFSDDPVGMALHWEELGARRLHVVDLEGARGGLPREAETIERIARAVSIPLQVGGGIRRLEHAHRYLRAGADRIVFGTAALTDPGLITAALAMDAGAVIVALDARDGYLQTWGWLSSSSVAAVDLARHMEALGVQRVLSTDISRDGTLSRPNFEGLAALKRSTGMAVIASGGVARVEHLVQLATLGMEAAIIGRALYDGVIDLREAIVAAGGSGNEV